MDKQTLSNYGWIVVMILCLSVVIAMATPFGQYIRVATENTLDGLFETQESALDVVYNKTITPNELEEKGYEFYSTLALAVEDANGLTTANADVEKENKETAIAGLKINGQEASIVLINDSENQEMLTLAVPIIIDLNNKTVNLENSGSLYSTDNFTINDGNIYLLNASNGLIVGGQDTYINNINIISEINNNFSSNTVCAINSNSNNINISNCDIQIENNFGCKTYAVSTVTNNESIIIKNTKINVKTNSGATRCLNLYNNNIEITNSDFVADGTTSNIYGAYIGSNSGTINVKANNSSFSSKSTSGKNIGINCRTKTGTIEMNNIEVSAVSETSTKVYGASFITTSNSTSTTINGGKYYASSDDISGGIALDIETSGGNAIINSTKNTPITAFGRYIGLQLLDNGNVGTFTVNGGDYSSTSHSGYISGNTTIKNAKFHSSNIDKYDKSEAAGLFTCDLTNGGNNVIEFYNCIIGEKIDKYNKYNYTITAKKQEYTPPKEINFYDCILYQGTTSVFSYNRVNEINNPTFTKFNLYGNTKLYYNNGAEIAKDELSNAINTWKNIENMTFGKTTTYATGSTKDINNIINIYWNCPDLNQDTNIENYITADANIYDYRN